MIVINIIIIISTIIAMTVRTILNIYIKNKIKINKKKKQSNKSMNERMMMMVVNIRLFRVICASGDHHPADHTDNQDGNRTEGSNPKPLNPRFW